MGFNEIYESIEKFLFDMMDKHVLVGVAIFLIIFAIVGGVIFLIVKLTYHPENNISPEKQFIIDNALNLCVNKSFNAWRFLNDSLQFECYNEKNATKNIEEYLNMSFNS